MKSYSRLSTETPWLQKNIILVQLGGYKKKYKNHMDDTEIKEEAEGEEEEVDELDMEDEEDDDVDVDDAFNDKDDL